jgi:hypothetical protein
MKSLFLLAGALVGLAACQNDTKVIVDRLDRIEKLVATRCGAGGGAAGQAQPQREEPAPDATFAVNVQQNVQLGMVEGPNDACVTVVEAWDFA